MNTKLVVLFLLLTPLMTFAQENHSKELYFTENSPRMNGPDVIRLQKFLVFKGYYIGRNGIDGWFGTDTDTALRQYQRTQKQPVTGRIRVSDIPEKLEWKPELHKKNKQDRPSASTEPAADIYEGILKTYYSTKKITFSSYDIHYSNYLLSPNRRFLYYEAYVLGAGEDPQNGHTHFVEDLLTGDRFVASGLSAMYNVNSDEYESVSTRCEGSYISDVFWTGDGNLYFVAHMLFGDTPEESQAFILYVK